MKKFFLVFLSLILLVSCSQKQEYKRHSFFVMDTFAEVRVYSGDCDTIAASKKAQALAEDIETSVSKTLSDSYAYKVNQTDSGIIECDEHFSQLFELSEKLEMFTNGYFTPLGGHFVELWKKCESEQRLPTDSELNEAVERWQNTRIEKISQNEISKEGNALLDFGAIGKGYAADRMTEALKRAGVETGMVTFVSTIAVFGERDFKIAVRTPDNSTDVAGYITMNNESLSVSGDYERFYTINGQKHGHIIDPYSGKPASNGIHSVAVVCESAAVADALSTAVFAMGVQKAMELYASSEFDFEMLIITDDNIIVTPGMAERFEIVSANYELAEV